MNMEEILQKTADHVRQEMYGESSGHDWFHVLRVWNLSKHIGAQENVDMFVVEMAALLHDLDDTKVTGSDSKEKKNAIDWMEGQGVDSDYQGKILYVIENMSFSDNLDGRRELTPEGMVVQDADRLDAIGAIGIGRTFAYGGKCGRVMYDPAHPPEKDVTAEHYHRKDTPTLNHFYEKLLTLKGLMNTETGKKMAEHRHAFMETYLTEFYGEWEGSM